MIKLRGNMCMSTDYPGFNLESLKTLKEKLTAGELGKDDIKELSYAIRIWLDLTGKSDPLDNNLKQIKIKAIELQIEIFKIWILDQKNGQSPYEGFSQFRDLPQELISAQKSLNLLTGNKEIKEVEPPPKKTSHHTTLEPAPIKKTKAPKLKADVRSNDVKKESNNWFSAKWNSFRKKYLSRAKSTP